MGNTIRITLELRTAAAAGDAAELWQDMKEDAAADPAHELTIRTRSWSADVREVRSGVREDVPVRAAGGQLRRFDTDTILVTGNSPAELESEAIAHAAMLTGWPPEQLAVQAPYRVCSTAAAEAVNAGALTTDQLVPLSKGQKLAIASGHALYASIGVDAYGPAPEAAEATEEAP